MLSSVLLSGLFLTIVANYYLHKCVYHVHPIMP